MYKTQQKFCHYSWWTFTFK